MSCFTTEARRPDSGEENIGQTRGVWLRKMNNGDYEIFLDGQFVVSYGNFSEYTAAAMIEYLYDYGFKQGQKKNQADLRKALGLKENG